MINQPMAGMESSGYWYHPAIMSTCILALRPERIGSVSHAFVSNYIEREMGGFLAMYNKRLAPSPNIARTWKKEIPGYPEEAWNSGMYEISDLPRWASDQLDWGAMKRDATMSQAPRTGYPHTTMRNSASSQVDTEGQGWGTGILAGGIVSGILIWGFSTRNRAVEGPARPGKPSPPKRLSLTGRRDKYKP